MQRISLELQPRDLGKKDEHLNLNQLRLSGFIPAVVYGHGAPVKVAIDNKIFGSALKNKAGANALFNVKLSGKTSLSIIKEIQRDIFSQAPIHVDFMRINMNEKIEINVPIHTEGIPDGVKNGGGILEHIERDLHVRCLPDDIPAEIKVDVTSLKVHDGIAVKDLPIPKGVEVLSDKNHVVINVVAPRVEEIPEVVPATDGAAEGAEPEVIAKGKKEEEGAEGEKAAPKKEEAKK